MTWRGSFLHPPLEGNMLVLDIGVVGELCFSALFGRCVGSHDFVRLLHTQRPQLG